MICKWVLPLSAVYFLSSLRGSACFCLSVCSIAPNCECHRTVIYGPIWWSASEPDQSHIQHRGSSYACPCLWMPVITSVLTLSRVSPFIYRGGLMWGTMLSNNACGLWLVLLEVNTGSVCKGLYGIFMYVRLSLSLNASDNLAVPQF